MRKTILILSLLAVFTTVLSAQSLQKLKLTPGGIFDKVSDRFGDAYDLSDLLVDNGTNINYIVPTQSCTAGYFRLYFAPGSVFSNSVAARTAMCALLTDVSRFISSPLSVAGNTNYINVYCYDVAPQSPGGYAQSPLGQASAYNIYPSNPNNPNQGVLDNAVYKYIISGKDPFSYLPTGLSNSQVFYHGFIRANPSPPAPWNFNLGSASTPTGEFDFYSLMLHEVTHMLGFYSLINSDGFSYMGANNNYFSRFDTHLTNPGGTPLLGNSAQACPNSSLSLQTQTTVLAALGTSTTGCITNLTSCSLAVRYNGNNFLNISLYTPNCFEPSTSLNHFEDMCPVTQTAGCLTSTSSAANDDKYFVMSNALGTGSCYTKRHLKEEERSVLCDLGYSVSGTFSSSAAAGNYTYMYGACPGPNAWGIDDGLVGGAFTYTALSSLTNTLNIPVSAVLSNDAAGVSMSCIEVITGAAAVNTVGSNLTVSITPGFTGIVIIKYLPKSSSGFYGSPTYIYCYFISGNCNPPNICNMIQNGGFEDVATGYLPCGALASNNSASSCKLNCFAYDSQSPDVYVRGCTSTVSTTYGCNLGIDSPDSYNGAPNNSILLLYGTTAYNLPGIFISESITNTLSHDLVFGDTYRLSFLVNNGSPQPFVLTVASNSTQAFVPTGLFPSYLNEITSFTIPVSTTPNGWMTVTHTFTFSSPGGQNHPVIVIGLDMPKTYSLSSGNYTCYIDDISLLPVSTPSFELPGSNNCGVKSYSNLAQFASPVPGNFSGTGVAYTNGAYSFNYPPSLPPGYYPIYFNYTTTALCTASIPQLIHIPGIDPGACAANRTLTASEFAYGTTFSWSPMGVTTSTAIISTTSVQVVTLIATNGTCQLTYTTLITPCCSQTLTTDFAGSFLTSNLSTPTKFNNDVVIPPYSNVTLSGSSFIFGEDKKITVSNGAQLTITNAHLYACGATLWKGIVVLAGGKVKTQAGTLIEDATTAIDNYNSPANGLIPMLEATESVFNKNYTSIRMSNSAQNSPGAYFIKSCVFTCRDLGLPDLSSSWPTTGTSSSLSTSAADLRHAFAATPTTGLASPYLNQSTFSITTLKNPYSSQSSHIAIKISSVGVTSGTTMYSAVIGSTANASDFNLFDAHGQFISAENSHLTSLNNVFQNTLNYYTGARGGFGGSAIYHSTGSTFNTQLLLTAPSVSVGNKFWNCHRGIDGKNVYRLWVENAIFRSTQSSSNTGYFPGNTGILLNTNRFEYYIAYNEFTNINAAINIPLSAGSFTAPPATFSLITPGIYADRLRIYQNTFTGKTSQLSNSYMSDAVAITCPNNTPLYAIINNSVSPLVNAVAINNNLFNEVSRGINVNGVKGFPLLIENNGITLKDDGSAAPDQYAVKLTNTTPTGVGPGGFGYERRSVISGNSAGFSTAPTNIAGALIWCGFNGYASLSPSVTCNTLVQGHRGFVFEHGNTQTIWAGNLMQDLDRGFVLLNNGVIGAQGGTFTAIANQWDNINSFETYAVSSTPSLSPLYIRNSPGFLPITNGGNFIGQIYDVNSLFITDDNGGDYDCSGVPNYKIVTPINNDYGSVSDEFFYMDQLDLYTLLYYNDSILTSDSNLEDFYNSLDGSTIMMYVHMDKFLFDKDYSSVNDFLSNIDVNALNSVELNYYSFFALYASFLESGELSEEQQTALYDLASLCPGTNGACIYQAQALYNSIYGELVKSSCSEESARKTRGNTALDHRQISNAQDMSIFPNPASNQLTIKTSQETDLLKIEVRDLSGRVMLNEEQRAKDFFVNLDLDLMNGAYMITVVNSKKQSVTKKLLIAR